MPHNSQVDSIFFDSLEFPYNRIRSALAEEPPRLIRGENCYVTPGGTLARRPGTIPLASGGISLRIDRTWLLETLDPTPFVYLVSSAFNPITNLWELWYQHESSTPTAWLQVPNLRDSNSSSFAHEASVSRGLLFVKGFPQASSSEKLGSIIFDGTGGTVVVKPWGEIGPTVPARIVGAVTALSAPLSAIGTSITVNSDSGFPGSSPYNIQIDFETLTVTAGAGGTTWTVTRGVNGTPISAHAAGSPVVWQNFSSSAHLVQVNVGWQYTYAYKDIQGNYSNRSPIETNPDNLPSTTGPFQNLIPKITLQGLADTTNFPTIAVFRTFDGGGTWFELTEIANPGAGSFTFQDNLLTSGSGQMDPLPDTQLNTAAFAPSLTSNSPPPTVLAPKVVGVDAPAHSTPIVFFAGRFWYGIGNVLFFSGNEEINLGVPECCWPSGITGNFYRLQYQITNVEATSEALYVFTVDQIYVLYGTTLDSFSIQPLFNNYGHPTGHPRAITRFGESIAFFTHDYRVAIISNTSIYPISDDLFTDLIDQLNLGAEFQINYFADQALEWLVVSGHIAANPSFSKQWTYDLKRAFGGDETSGGTLSHNPQNDFWFVPWTYPSTNTYSGRISERSSQRRLCWFNWDPTNDVGYFVRIDPTGRTGTDTVASTTAPGYKTQTYNLDLVSNLFMVPPGNHVNRLRKPYLTPVLYGVMLERTFFAGETDPDFFYYLDDLWTNPIPNIDPQDPDRRQLSTAYSTTQYLIQEVCQRFAFELRKLNSSDLFELLTVAIMFTPDAGS